MLLRIHDTESVQGICGVVKKARLHINVEPLLTNPSINKTKVKSNYRTHQKQKSGAEQLLVPGDPQSGGVLQYLPAGHP